MYHKIHPFKVTIQWVLVHSQNSATLCNFRTFLWPWKETLTVHFFMPLFLAASNLLSVSMSLPILGISNTMELDDIRNCVWLPQLGMSSRFIVVVTCINTSIPFYGWHNIPLYGYRKFCLSIHQLEGFWGVSTIWLLWIMPLWTFVYKFLYRSWVYI